MDALLDASKVRPLAYQVTLALCAPPRAYFEGSVDITIRVEVATPMFLLHASGLSISGACFVPSGTRASCLQASRDVISISTGAELAPGTYCLRLCFGGSVRLNRTDGIYACTWRHDPTSWILGTHFEPGHCRSAFPCFDQPHFKATFGLTIITPETDALALSNTEAELDTTDMSLATSALDAGGAALLSRLIRQSMGSPDGVSRPSCQFHVTKFRPTPVVATYVVGFWVGRFSSLKTKSRTGTMLNFFLPPVAHQVDEGGFSRDLSVRAYDFFSELFQVPLPLTKLDIICLPRMHGVGMEGFGAVTIMQDYMLVSPTTDFARRRRIARLLCHEISHQWFGDLVTPASFDELWLKESTARLFEYIAVDALEPHWRVWPNFVTEVTYMAMLADALPTSHAVVQQHRGDLKSIVESFDVITYGKGASVLRMLCDHLGVDRFVRGIQRFISTFQFRNASMDDLWAALEAEAGGACCLPSVACLMDPWLTRSGCPALHVEVARAADGSACRLTLTQKSLRLGPASGGLDIVDPAKQRCIPLKLRVGQRGQAAYTLSLLVGEAAPLVVDLTPYLRPSSDGEDWLVVNSSHAGYFATVYDSAAAWDMARQAVAGGHASDVEAVGMVCDLMLSSQAALKMMQHTAIADASGANCAGITGSGAGGTCGAAMSSSSFGSGGVWSGSLINGGRGCSSAVDGLLGRLEELVYTLRGQQLLQRQEEGGKDSAVLPPPGPGGSSSGSASSSPAWIVGQLFLWDIRLLMLMREVEQVERRCSPADDAGLPCPPPPLGLAWTQLPMQHGLDVHHHHHLHQQYYVQQHRAAAGVAHEMLSDLDLACQLVEAQVSAMQLQQQQQGQGGPPMLSEYVVKMKTMRSRMISVISRLSTAGLRGHAPPSSFLPALASPPCQPSHPRAADVDHPPLPASSSSSSSSSTMGTTVLVSGASSTSTSSSVMVKVVHDNKSSVIDAVADLPHHRYSHHHNHNTKKPPVITQAPSSGAVLL